MPAKRANRQRLGVDYWLLLNGVKDLFTPCLSFMNKKLTKPIMKNIA